jgi:hypothetical protein
LPGSSFKDKGNENVALKMAAENEGMDNTEGQYYYFDNIFPAGATIFKFW